MYTTCRTRGGAWISSPSAAGGGGRRRVDDVDHCSSYDHKACGHSRPTKHVCGRMICTLATSHSVSSPTASCCRTSTSLNVGDHRPNI